MSEPLLIARTPDTELFLLPGMANRHGLITGATGTGKTVTQVAMPIITPSWNSSHRTTIADRKRLLPC